MKMGAMTFTSWARFAIFTTSAWRMKELRNMPMDRASAKSYFSSRPVAPISASVMPGVIVRYQEFHSSKAM